MNPRLAAPLLAAAAVAAGCAGAQRAGRLPPLEDEGEVYLYLDPLARSAERLAVTIAAIQAVTADGRTVPLDVALNDLSAGTVRSQRLLASGRVPPGQYAALLVQVKRATVAQEDGVSDLVVPPEPVRLATQFSVGRRKATVLWARLDVAASVTRVAFSPAFAFSAPEAMLPDLSGYCTNSGDHTVTVFDRRTHKVVAVIPVGRRPTGIALDVARRRAYVALSGDDEILILDVQTTEEVGRIPLRPGDRPSEVQLTPDGRTLVVVNADSDTVAFLDPVGALEVGRAPIGIDPVFLLLDGAGQRAYVVNRMSASITVLDVPNRAVVTVVATEPEPVRAAFNRNGDRLYVLQSGSPYLAVYASPDLALLPQKVMVGLGATALELDRRTDLFYVGGRAGGPLRVFDPASLLPIGRLQVPGPVTRGEIDDVEDVLFTVVPALRKVAANELVSGKAADPIDVGHDPYQVTVVGARR
jgi:YVTN family beta-propeller protein